MKTRFVIDNSDPWKCVIQDIEEHINYFVLCESGFGLSAKTLKLAEAVCKFLNEKLPDNFSYFDKDFGDIKLKD